MKQAQEFHANSAANPLVCEEILHQDGINLEAIASLAEDADEDEFQLRMEMDRSDGTMDSPRSEMTKSFDSRGSANSRRGLGMLGKLEQRLEAGAT